ncbi:MAG: type II toxin-antitoxin system VapC family toxin [Defluviitaleaceae bacterium]|nr:type II toxin-antitoxin system VapC family toxin [Defluviitaleaceae bacterium]MCL2239723.1 type II toxin-antitoxin system VapC family toxin [Defluviitaleaceae bacterium]
MEYILDTHVLLWLIFDSNKLSDPARKVLSNGFVRKHVCASSLWEISIKNRIGKLPLPDGMPGILSAIRERGFGIIGLDYLHIEAYNALPLVHRDPFDGIIAATAHVEAMTIITADENIQKFDVSWIW